MFYGFGFFSQFQVIFEIFLFESWFFYFIFEKSGFWFMVIVSQLCFLGVVEVEIIQVFVKEKFFREKVVLWVIVMGFSFILFISIVVLVGGKQLGNGGRDEKLGVINLWGREVRRQRGFFLYCSIILRDLRIFCYLGICISIELKDVVLFFLSCIYFFSSLLIFQFLRKQKFLRCNCYK